jgi:hypothetical protein
VAFFSIIASARLHGLDPEQYLNEAFLLRQWPRDRYVELAPKYWRATRARLTDQAQLFELKMGWLKSPSRRCPPTCHASSPSGTPTASTRRPRRRDGALAEPGAVCARGRY